MGGNLSPLGRMTHSNLGEKVRVILRIFMLQKTERLGCQSSVTIVVQRHKMSRKDAFLGYVLAVLLSL